MAGRGEDGIRRREAVLTDLAYATLLDDGAWAALMAELAACLPDGRSTLTLHSQRAASGVVPLTHGFTDDFQARYNAYFGARNPWLARVGERPVGLGERAEARLPFAELEKTEFYQDFLRHFGIGAGVGVTAGRHGERHFLVSVVGDRRDSAEQEAVATMLTRLAPHLARVLEIGRQRPYQHAMAVRPLGAGLDAGGIAALCIGAGRRLLWANGCGEALLAAGDGFGLSVTGQVRLGDETASAALDRALSLVASAEAVAPVSMRRWGGAAGEVTICRLEPGVMQAFLQQPAALVIATPPRPAVAASDAAWLKGTGLTERERAIAADLIAGRAPAEIAAARGISVETVRSHLKQIYAKLGVRRQAELVALAVKG